jgi:hypothetical protein
MEYYSATNKGGIISFEGKWMELKIIVLSKIRQAQKAKYNMFSLIVKASPKIMMMINDNNNNNNNGHEWESKVI